MYHTNKRLQYLNNTNIKIKCDWWRNTIDRNFVFRLLYSSTNLILFLFLYYFKYCNRLFYSHLAFLAPDED